MTHPIVLDVESSLQALREHILECVHIADNAFVPALDTPFYAMRTPGGLDTLPDNDIAHQTVLDAD